HVVALPNSLQTVRDAMERTIRWARRCQSVTSPEQAQFGIVQGGLDPSLREYCAKALADLNFPGYAIGGLSVGEEPAEMYRMIEATCPYLPPNKPRYLMGVGRPEDLLNAIYRGVDLFDCVMPTRNGRNALAFTDHGTVRLRNQKHARDPRPLMENCPCAACSHSLGYLRHLFLAKEMLGPILLSIHNLTYYQTLLRDAREAILTNQFVDFFRQKMSGWQAATA
ncbi:MAG: tRNA-guanine transglycosylase, partial [Planctomycetales bacterium]|nr:tRNA-guanine transglycosylase [Planctomycetales bacterium]